MVNILLDGLYRIVNQSDTQIDIELSDASHPVFKAHFENSPLLPGFLQLDIIAEILNKEIDTISNAKFMKPILPKMQISYVISETKRGERIKIIDFESSTFSDFRVTWKRI